MLKIVKNENKKALVSRAFSKNVTLIAIIFPVPFIKIANMPNNVFTDLHNISRGRFSSNQFVKLKALAKKSIGNSNPFFELQLSSLISLLNECNKQIDLLKKQIYKIIKTLKPYILSIPGIGSITAATIYSGIGNFKSFSSANKIVAFASLNVGYYQSSTAEYSVKMVKHSSSLLRYAIMNATLPLLQYSPTFSSYYAKKRSEGKSHRVTLSHLAKKLVRVMFTLETKNIYFNSKLLV